MTKQPHNSEKSGKSKSKLKQNDLGKVSGGSSAKPPRASRIDSDEPIESTKKSPRF